MNSVYSVVKNIFFVILSSMKKFPLLILIIFITTGCSRVGEALNEKGAEAFGLNHLEAARRYLHWSTTLDPNNPAAWNNQGYVLYLSKFYDQSEKAFTEALARTTDQKLIWQIKLNQALLYCDQHAISGPPPRWGWNQKGIELFKELIRGDSQNAELHMRLGFAYFQAANPGGGFSEFEKAVQFATPKIVAHYSSNPVEGSKLILRQVQKFYVGMGYFKKATELQTKIKNLEKSQPPVSKSIS